ncbi:protein of unknown function [Magnetospirillum sp. XM-1]|nr:protein of unknown function [Magnetospirillum sp. XM-1]
MGFSGGDAWMAGSSPAMTKERGNAVPRDRNIPKESLAVRRTIVVTTGYRPCDPARPR